MALFGKPACSCGVGHAGLVCAPGDDPVDTAVVRAVFGGTPSRRRMLRTLGTGTAMAALSQFFPLAAAREAFAQAPGPLAKKAVKIGFIPITCATPITMAEPMGFYPRQGLQAQATKNAGWGVIPAKPSTKE